MLIKLLVLYRAPYPKLVQIYCALTYLFILLLPTCAVLANPPDNLGLIFSSAKQNLAKGNFDEAINKLRVVNIDGPISGWVDLYISEGLMLNNQFGLARTQLKRTKYIGLQSAYAAYLAIELDLFEGIKVASQRISKLNSSISGRLNREVQSKRDLILALVDNQHGKVDPAILKLQKVRAAYPNSISAFKAERLQKILIGQSDLRQNEQYWVQEINILLSSNRSSEAQLIASQHLTTPYPHQTSEMTISHLALRIRVLKALQQNESVNALLNKFSQHPYKLVREYATEELGVLAWQSNQYDKSIKLLQKLDSTRSKFVLARIAEEQGNFEEALLGYLNVTSRPIDSYVTQGWQRLLPLAIWAKKKLNNVPQSDVYKYTSKLDQEMIKYWLARLRAKPLPNFPVTSYYGKTPSSHSFGSVSPASCKVTPFKPNSQTTKYIKLLQLGRLDELAFDELNFEIPIEISGLGKVKIFSDFGFIAKAIAALLSDTNTINQLEGSCANDYFKLLYPKPYLATYKKYGAKYGISTSLLLAVSRSESLFDVHARSRTGALGLMQLMPATAVLEANELGLDLDPKLDLYDPITNIMLGSKHLSRLLKKYENQEYLAIAAYNAGSNAVDKWMARLPIKDNQLWIELIPYKETRDYVRKVIAAKQVYDLAI